MWGDSFTVLLFSSQVLPSSPVMLNSFALSPLVRQPVMLRTSALLSGLLSCATRLGAATKPASARKFRNTFVFMLLSLAGQHHDFPHPAFRIVSCAALGRTIGSITEGP